MCKFKARGGVGIKGNQGSLDFKDVEVQGFMVMAFQGRWDTQLSV